MKKCAPIAALGLLACGMSVCAAGLAVADEFPSLPPLIEMYGGVNLLHTEDAPRSSYASPLHEPRAGTSKPFEYQDEHSSLLLGGLVEAYPLPQRFYLEAKVEGDDDWFGELQHSYKDYYQFRLLSRRFEHNLDNLTLFNAGPMLNPPLAGALVDRQDVGREYSLGLDIDTLKLRLKTPNFPLHLYTEGELVRRDGSRQLRFLGGSSDNSGAKKRVSQAREVDQESRELTVGVNSHLRWLEADLAHSRQDFADDASAPYYDYLANVDRQAGTFVHNQVPELTASKNTLRVHTTQTGQVFASATLMDLERENNSSGAEASRQLGHGDLMWTPRVNLTVGAKFRHQENDSAGPTSVATTYYTPAHVLFDPAPVLHGVEGATDSLTTFVRYAPSRKLTLKGQFGIERLGRDEDSAVDWRLAEDKKTETIDLGAAWRPRRDLKLKAKYLFKDTDVDPGAAIIFNNDPERTHQYAADLTFLPTASTSLLLSAMLRQDKADNLQMLDLNFDPVSDPAKGGVDDFDALWQRYLASVTHACTERFSVSGSYAYSVMDTERGFAAETATAGSYIIDEDYSNQQAYHNLGLGASWQATDRMSLEATVDYTLAMGDYVLTEPLLRQDLSLGAISEVETRELGLRLDGEYELGQGWKAGVILRYVDWSNESFDNPADGDMAGALFKLSKTWR